MSAVDHEQELHPFRRIALERRRPRSTRQTTVRSFKIVRNWLPSTTEGNNYVESCSEGGSQDFDSKGNKAIRPQEASAPILSTSGQHKATEINKLSSTSDTDKQNNTPESIIPDDDNDKQRPPVTSELDSQATLLSLPSTDKRERNSTIIVSPRVDEHIGLQKVTDRSTEMLPDSTQLELSTADKSPSKNKQLTGSYEDAVFCTTPITQMSVTDQSPTSGPVCRHRKPKIINRKRKLKDVTAEEEDGNFEEEYEGNKFVRLFNADHGRKKCITEIMDLDVVLTMVEEVALDYRCSIQSSAGKQAVKEFFIQMRRAFSNSIDTYKETKLLKANASKSNSCVRKLRKELLAVQQQRSEIKEKIAKAKIEYKNEGKLKELEELSAFLQKFENKDVFAHREISNKQSKEDLDRADHLGHLIETREFLFAANNITLINKSIKRGLDCVSKN